MWEKKSIKSDLGSEKERRNLSNLAWGEAGEAHPRGRGGTPELHPYAVSEVRGWRLAPGTRQGRLPPLILCRLSRLSSFEVYLHPFWLQTVQTTSKNLEIINNMIITLNS